MKKEEAMKNIIEYFENNEEIFNNCIEELDSYNGYLGDDRYYEMDELDELFCNTPITNLLNMAYFGIDEESWHTDEHGEKHYDSFNPNRNYFTFDGCGNLVSANYKDYSGFLDEYAIKDMAANIGEIYSIEENEELMELFKED